MCDLTDEIENLTQSQKQTYNFLKKTWEMEGYNLTKDDEESLIKLLKSETSANIEVEKILNKFKKGSNEDAWIRQNVRQRKI